MHSPPSSGCIRSHYVLPPLITEEANSHAVLRHSMDRIIEIIQKVNPGQIPVITGDQPVYALGKQVQWMIEKYKQVILMMGELQIEKNDVVWSFRRFA